MSFTIVCQHTLLAPETSIWPCLTASNHEMQEIHHATKFVLQSCSALMIITNMPLAQDQSVIPKLVCFEFLSRSDSSIRSTSRLKHAFATNMFAPRRMPDSLSTIITPSLSFFKEARELCESLLNPHCAPAQQNCF